MRGRTATCDSTNRRPEDPASAPNWPIRREEAGKEEIDRVNTRAILLFRETLVRWAFPTIERFDPTDT